jgi:hypothetical protein
MAGSLTIVARELAEVYVKYRESAVSQTGQEWH